MIHMFLVGLGTLLAIMAGFFVLGCMIAAIADDGNDDFPWPVRVIGWAAVIVAVSLGLGWVMTR